MSYPSVSFNPTSPFLGMQPIGATSATQAHPLGTLVKATDVTYGEAEFVYLKGVASTAPGDFVCYDQKAGTTVRAVHGGTGSNGPGAVAMSANVASQYGWYLVGGSGPAKTGTVAANSAGYLTSTAGQIDDAPVAGDVIVGLLIKAADSGGYATCQLDRPSVGGQGSTTTISGLALTPVAKVFADSPVTLGAQTVYLCNPVAGDIVLNLPAASATPGRTYFVALNTGNSAHTVTFAAAGADSIRWNPNSGAPSLVADGDSATLVSDGVSAWFVQNLNLWT